jgi:hypothetical protein
MVVFVVRILLLCSYILWSRFLLGGTARFPLPRGPGAGLLRGLTDPTFPGISGSLERLARCD